MKDGHFTLLIVPEDESSVRQFRFSYRMLRRAGLLTGALGVVILVGAGMCTGLIGGSGRMAMLERENRRLETQVGQIAENLERSERTYQQIRTLAGLEDLPSPAAAITVPVVQEAGAAESSAPPDDIPIEELAGPAELQAAEPPPSPEAPIEELAGPGELRAAGPPIDEQPEPDEITAETLSLPGEPTDPPPAVEPPAGASPVEDHGAAPWGWPLTVKGFVTARFEGPDGHTGVDIAVPRETPVLATAPGRVSEAGSDPVLGRYVILAHAAGMETLYGHNARLLVEPGQRVERAEAIAYSGNSGRSTAPHLHYEIRKAGRPVDPDPYLH